MRRRTRIRRNIETVVGLVPVEGGCVVILAQATVQCITVYMDYTRRRRRSLRRRRKVHEIAVTDRVKCRRGRKRQLRGRRSRRRQREPRRVCFTS